MGNAASQPDNFGQIIDGLISGTGQGGVEAARAALGPLLEVPKAAEEVFGALPIVAVRRLREEKPETVASIITQLVHLLETSVDVAEFKEGTSVPLLFRAVGEDTTRVSNALRLLTRILPIVLEGEIKGGEGHPWAYGLFGMGPLAQAFDDAMKGCGMKKSATVAAPPPPCPPVGVRLAATICNLASCCGFTLPAHATAPMWAEGISTVEGVPLAAESELWARADLARALTALCSEALFLPAEEYHKTMLISLLNTVLGYDPAANAWMWNYWTKDVHGVLFDTSLHALLVLMDYRNPWEVGASPGSPPAADAVAAPRDGRVNVFAALFSRINHVSDLAFIYNGLQRLIQNPVEIHQDPYKVKRKVDTYAEVLVLTWRFLEGNEALLRYATSPAAGGGLGLLEPIMALAWMARGDQLKVGLVHCGIFIILLLSGQRDFSVALNAPISATPGVRLIGGIENGTHADVLVHLFHALIFEGGARTFPLFSTMLTVLTNVAPFVKGFSLASADKLLSTLEYFVNPEFLFAAQHNYGYAKYMLEVINHAIQHQPDGNAHLVHAVIRRRDIVAGLVNLSLPAIYPALESPEPRRVTWAEKLEETSDEAKGGAAPAGAGGAGGAAPGAADAAATSGGERGGGGASAEVAAGAEGSEGEGAGGAAAAGAGAGAGAGGAPAPPGPWVPTRQWLEGVRAQMPTTVLQRLLAGILPGLEAFCEHTGAVSEDRVLDYLQQTTLVGLIPVPRPIVVRKFKPNPYTSRWFSAYAWGLIFLGQRDSPQQFLDSGGIRLFHVAFS